MRKIMDSDHVRLRRESCLRGWTVIIDDEDMHGNLAAEESERGKSLKQYATAGKRIMDEHFSTLLASVSW